MHFTLKIDDGICKGFKDEEGTDLFVNKAYDEETNTHCLLIFMPSFPKYNLLGIQQPLAYESEQQRDEFYTHGVNDEFANTFIKNLCEHVENSRKNAENQG